MSKESRPSWATPEEILAAQLEKSDGDNYVVGLGSNGRPEFRSQFHNGTERVTSNKPLKVTSSNGLTISRNG